MAMVNTSAHMENHGQEEFFPPVDTVRKVLYLAIMKAKERWTMPILDWRAGLYHISIAFPGRVAL